MNDNLLRLAEQYPLSINDIRPVFIDCHKIYYPSDKSVSKCRDVIEFALSSNISLIESFKLQMYIDLYLM